MRIRDLVAVNGLFGLYAMGIFVWGLLIAAWTSPGRQILVTIDDYGEGAFELVLVPVLLVLGIFGLVQATRALLGGREKRGERERSTTTTNIQTQMFMFCVLHLFISPGTSPPLLLPLPPR